MQTIQWVSNRLLVYSEDKIMENTMIVFTRSYHIELLFFSSLSGEQLLWFGKQKSKLFQSEHPHNTSEQNYFNS